MERGTRNHARSGFSLAETLVVLGILLALAGLLIPALSSAQQASRRTVLLDDMRTFTAGIVIVADGNDGRTMPYVDERYDGAGWAAVNTHRVLVREGVASSSRALDRVGTDLTGNVTLWGSPTLYARPGEFREDQSLHFQDLKSEGVQLAVARSPSSKGIAWQVHSGPSAESFWCCVEGVANRGPVGFLDGHVQMRSIYEFEWFVDSVSPNGIGLPVISTIGGLRGVDRIARVP